MELAIDHFVQNAAFKIEPSWQVAREPSLLERALELSGHTLLVCSAGLDVISAHGTSDGLLVDGELEPSLAVELRAWLTTRRRCSPFALRGCPDFRLLRVETNADGQLLIWLKQGATTRTAFSKLLRERYGFKLRSQQLLTLLSQGLGNREIAEQLGLRETTVKTYLHQVYETLGVRSRGAALAELRRALNFEQL
jgi:DNA-binding CsgD family transcriptional regulator